MAEISAALVKELRDQTGAPMMDCKRALQETNGDMRGRDAPPAREGHGGRREALRPRDDRGQGRLPARRGRTSAGTMVAVGCETEPVSNNDEFLDFAEKVLEAVEADGPGAEAALDEERVAARRQARREHRRRRRGPLRGGRRRDDCGVRAPAAQQDRRARCRCAAARTTSRRKIAMHIAAIDAELDRARRRPGRDDRAGARDLRELGRGAVEAGAGAATRSSRGC